MVVAVIAGIVLLFGIVYIFREPISGAFAGDEETKKAEAAKAAERDEKGAIGNTIDFFFGDGTHARNKAKAAREAEGAQVEVERPNNVNPSNPSEPTPWESLTTWWTDNVSIHFEQQDAANPPAPPVASQGPPALEVQPVVHTQPPTEAAPQGDARPKAPGRKRQPGRRGTGGRG